MTLDEKLNQLTLLSDGQMKEHPEEARKPVGSVFSETDPVLINKYQRDAVQNSRLKIPILFAFDTIHGFRTVFPTPLAAGSSFDPDVAFTDHRIGAFESAAVGIKQIYSPMVDVSHEPRWGRIVEAAGEDPYLNSVMAAARVTGAQGRDYSAPDKTVTSVKHYVAYGEPENGRDYNTTDLSEQRLRNLYLPPFKAAIDAGADTVMCSFNAIDGVPGCANPYTETDILKREWGFDGFIESDYTAVTELRACPGVEPEGGPCGHGVAANGREAAALALNAGTDSEMVSTTFRDYGRELVARGQVSMKRIDDAVRRILRIKFRAGLFENPYVDVAAAPGKMLKPENRAAARKAAGRSVVLLKNQGNVLPISTPKKTALIGPLGDAASDMLGPWWGRGDPLDAITLQAGMQAQNPATTYTAGCTMTHNDLDDPAGECATVDIAAVTAAANAAEQVVIAVGETREMGGEAEVRSNLDLPGKPAGDHRRGQGHRQAVRGRAVQLAPADAGPRRRRGARDPRGVVRRGGGGQRRRRRAVRQGQPGRQAAGLVPAQRRADPDLLQPRADGPAVRRGVEVRLAPPRHPVVRAAVRVRLRAELHDVHRRQPAAVGELDVLARVDHRERRGDEHRHGRRRRGRAALHPRSGGVDLAARPPAARLRARDARARRVEDRAAGSWTRATSASTTTGASSGSSRA